MTIDEVIEMLNSEDCKLATSICLMRYRERDCWKCILKEYSKTVYNKAIDDAKSVILQTLDNEILVDTLHLRLEQLKAGERNERSI